MPAQARAPDSRDEILSIDWDPEIRLTHGLNTFFPTVSAYNGYVHATASNASAFEPYYIRSLNNGDAWSEQVCLIDTPGVSAIFNYLFSNSNYISFPFIGNGIFRSIYSSDFGQTWSDWRRTYIQGFELSVTSMDSTLYAIFYTYAHNMECYYSINHGYRWYYHSTKRYLEGESALGATPSALHMIVERGNEEIYYCKYLFSQPGWSDTVRISDYLEDNSFNPEMTAWGDSNLAVIWLDYKYSPYGWTGDILMRRSTDNGEFWLPEQQLTFNHLAFGKNITQRNDSLFMIYDEIVLDGETNSEEVFFNLSPDGGVTWGEPVRVTYSPWKTVEPAVAIDGRSHPCSLLRCPR